MFSMKTARAEWKAARAECHATLAVLCADMGCTVEAFESENAPKGPTFDAWHRACVRFGDATHELHKIGIDPWG